MLSIDKQILFLLTRVEVIPVQRFIEIYTARGYSPQSVRNVLSRLKQAGYIHTTERSHYAITSHGRSTLTSIQGKGYHYGEQWDGQWHLVMFEIPESERSKRYQLKNTLHSLGFANLYTNSYVSPWNYADEVSRQLNELSLNEYVTQLRGSFQHFAITPERAHRMWELEQVRQIQLAKWQWFHDTFKPSLERDRAAKDDLQIFIRYLELGEAMGEVVIRDPMLPAELLPKDWMGQQILIAFHTLFTSLAEDIPKDKYYYPLMNHE